MDKKLSRVELIKQLQAISIERGSRELMSGAMCYCPAPHRISTRWFDKFTRIKIVWCNKCHRLFLCDRDQNEINKHVKSIASMGYDVKVVSLCKKCCKELKKELYPGIEEELIIDNKYTINIPLEKRNYVFYFRTDSNKPYHRAIANDSVFYQDVEQFLRLEQFGMNCDSFTRWQLHVIEYMTGWKIDE